MWYKLCSHYSSGILKKYNQQSYTWLQRTEQCSQEIEYTDRVHFLSSESLCLAGFSRDILEYRPPQLLDLIFLLQIFVRYTVLFFLFQLIRVGPCFLYLCPALQGKRPQPWVGVFSSRIIFCSWVRREPGMCLCVKRNSRRPLCSDHDMEVLLKSHSLPTEKCLLMQVLKCPDISSVETCWQELTWKSWCLQVMIGDCWANSPGFLKCVCPVGKDYFPITMLAEAKVYLSLSCCFSLPWPLMLWFCITHCLIRVPSKWSPFQWLIRFSLCLEFDLVIVWLEDERMQCLI